MHRHAAALLFTLCSLPVFSQSAPSFEVADVKPNKSGDARLSIDFQPGGKFAAHNVPLKILIALAWHVRPDAITGGPGWLGSDRFDVVAKAAQTTPPDELRRMLQTLLAERFKLVLHSDRKPGPAYALRVAKNGPKLQPSDAGLLTARRCVPADAPAGRRQVACSHMSMALLADTLQEVAAKDIDAPVVDQTGLTGAYDFTLAWTPAASPATEAPQDAPTGPSLSDALETQLGLKLERTKLPLPVIAVDSVERVPLEN